MSEEFARNLAVAMGVVFVVVLLVSLPRLIQLRREMDSPPTLNRWVLPALALLLVFRLIDWLAG